MLKNRNFRVVLSLIIAVLMWIYVVGSVNPAATKQIRNIPLTFNHTDVLGERGLAVSGTSLDGIDIEITGARIELSEIETSDIMATVDLASCTKGENELTVMIKVPSGIEVTDRSTNKVVVSVEDLIQKPVDITVQFSGTFADGQEGSISNMSTDQVIVTGAESIVNLVQSVRGTIDASRISATATELTCQLQAVNGDGNPVEGVTLSQETVTVEALTTENKSVKLNVEIIDNSSDELVRNTSVPETINITGRAEAMAGIDSIDAIPVDITNIAESEEIPLEFELPEGIKISEKDAAPVIQLTVSALESKELTYKSTDIKVEGRSNEFDYTLDEDQEVVVTIMDSAQVLEGIAKEDIALSVNVAELSEGTGEVTIDMTFDGKLHSIEANPTTINIECRRKNG